MTRCIELARRLRHTGADVPIAWWRFYRVLALDDEDARGSIAYFVGRGLEGLGQLPAARRAYGQAVDRNRAAGILPWLRRAEHRLAGLDAAVIRP